MIRILKLCTEKNEEKLSSSVQFENEPVTSDSCNKLNMNRSQLLIF